MILKDFTARAVVIIIQVCKVCILNTKYFERGCKHNAISFILHTPMTNGEILVSRKFRGIKGNRILFIQNNGEMKRIGGAEKS